MTTNESSNPTGDSTIDWADKVAKLLAQAEGAGTEGEARVFRGKAIAMMERHAITDAMLDSSKGLNTDDIGTDEVYATGIFGPVQRTMFSNIASAMDMPVAIYDALHQKPKKWVTIMHGFKSDRERAKVLIASVQLQVISAEAEWRKAQEQNEEWASKPGFEKFKDRREFFNSFGQTVAAKLMKARSEAIKEAAAKKAKENETKPEDEKEKVALAVQERGDAVTNWFENFYGPDGLRKGRRPNTARGSLDAELAGHKAGLAADLGTGAGTVGTEKQKELGA